MRLRAAGLAVWLDEEDLRPGLSSQSQLESAIRASRSVVVLVGADGLGPWEKEELEAMLQLAVRDGRPVIPVLLPDAPEAPQLPLFLSNRHWVDLRPGATAGEADAIDRLIFGITGKKRPGAGTAAAPASDGEDDTAAAQTFDSQCATPEIQALSDQLHAAYEEQERLISGSAEGAEVQAVQARILELRRRIREGGRLRVGDFVLDGRYKLIEQLKQGGFGTIFRAFDARARRLVAIKLLHGQYADDRSRRERFFRGARKMAALQHQGIVQVLDPKQVDEGHYFFVMEYLPGGDLRDAVLKQLPAPGRVLDLILEVGAALAFAHARRMIHRDVKPANIVLDADGRPKLTDFDLVRAGDTTGGTRTGALGTVGYAAPEAMQRPQDADARADVYGLGMTAVFALRGLDPSLVEVLRDREGFIDRLPVPAAVKSVLDRSIAWEAADRYPSIQAFCEALRLARAKAEPESAAPPIRADRGAEVCAEPKLAGSSGGTSDEGVAPAGPTPFRDSFRDRSGDGPEMIWLPGGTFRMGSPEGAGLDEERPAHEVTLSHYAVGKYPVTVGAFRRFVEATGYRTEAEEGDGAYVYSKGIEKVRDASWRNPYMDQDDRHPVVCISWKDAKAYCDWLSEQTGQVYGLLTEAQWEHACRAGSDTAWCFGESEFELEEYAWFSRNAGNGTRPVGEKRANAWQLHDMHGNCWEWCEDWYAGYSENPEEDPSGPESGSRRVRRGGSWDNGAGRCRSAYRIGLGPSLRHDYLGFRLSRTGPLHSYPFTLGLPEPEPKPEPIPGLRDTLQDGGEGPSMVWLPGGLFTMGQNDSPHDDERPAHQVRVDAFAIGQYPVTFEEYDRYCKETGSKKPDDRGWGRGKRPVINVSWEDAQAYCKWLSERTGESYRFATEAEWEYACRAGTQTRWSCGDDEARLGDYAWYGKNAGGNTHPVGEKQPNAWHLHDMHGNIWEWCQDWFASDYYEQLASELQRHSKDTEAGPSVSRADSSSARVAASKNPGGPESGSLRVRRGGSWFLDADRCRSAYRGRREPSVRLNYLGFRLSRTGPWRSHPITLGGAQRDDDESPQPGLAEPAQRGSSKPRRVPEPTVEPFNGFRDRLVILAKDNKRQEIEAPEMVYLPGGTFRMGDERGYDNEKPAHLVRLDAFAIGRTPVTWGDYRRFCEAADSHWPEWLEEGSSYHLDSGSNKEYYSACGVGRDALDLPVVGISWEEARAYCEWLSELTGKPYRLPTEAQWEYACRAGTETRWSCGDTERDLDAYAWYSGNSGAKLHPVALRRPNPWGLFDMHGNVWEWCADWYAEDYYEKLSSASEQPASGAPVTASENPSGPESGSHRVRRGGSWDLDAGDCRSACRLWDEPSARDLDLGFRLSRTV